MQTQANDVLIAQNQDKIKGFEQNFMPIAAPWGPNGATLYAAS